MGLFRINLTVPPERLPERAEAAKKPGLWSDGFGRVGTRSLQILAVLAVVSLAVFGMTRLSLLIIPLIIALIIASAMHPLVEWMRKKGLPSMVATWATLVGVLAVIGGLVWLIVAQVQDQWKDLAESATEGVKQLWELAKHLPFSISEDQLDDLIKTATDFLTSSQFGSGAIAGLSATASFLTGLVLMIVVLFFFLKDGPKIWEFLLRPFEGEGYARARRIGDKTVKTLGGYVRGTSTVAAVDAIGIGIGLWILGVPLALPLAVIVFMTAFIPMVGATLAGILAALVALVANGPVAAIIVVGIVVLVNQLEGNFLQPIVMGRSLKLHALVILLALTAGTVLAGIVGAVLSVPIAAVAWGVITVWNGENEPAYPMKQKRPEAM